MKDLQSIIDKRAEVKLINELNECHNFLYEKKYRFICDANIYLNIGTTDKPENISLQSLFSSSYRIYKELYDFYIEKYKEAETILFLKEIEDLKQRTSELHDEVSNLNY